MPEIKNTAEKETKSERKQSKRRITENIYRSSERLQKKFWQLSTLLKKKKVLKCSWFLLRVGKLSNCNSNIHDLGGYIKWNFCIWIRYLQTELLQSWQNNNMGWKHISKHSKLWEVKITASSLLLFAHLLSIPFPCFLNLSNFVNILEDFNLNFKDESLTQQLPFGLNL